MIYISVDVDFSEAEAKYTDEELRTIILTMKKASSITNLNSLTELEKQAISIMDQFKVNLPKIFSANVGQAKYLSMSEPRGNLLVLPILVEISDYRDFYKNFCRLGNDFDSVCFGQIRMPRVINSKDYKVYSEELELPFAIEGYNNGTLTAKYELPDSVLVSYIKYIAENLGIKGVSAIFPSLSKYNICSSETYFCIEEMVTLNCGTIVYAK